MEIVEEITTNLTTFAIGTIIGTFLFAVIPGALLAALGLLFGLTISIPVLAVSSLILLVNRDNKTPEGKTPPGGAEGDGDGSKGAAWTPPP